MFFKLMIILMLSLSVIMPVTQSPFIMCLLVLAMTFFSCCLVSFFSSLWMSYALVIVFLGGMMVLFTYASSMSVNNKSTQHLSVSGTFSFLVFFFFLSVPLESGVFMGSLYMGEGKIMLIMSTFYLLISLVMVVKIVELKEGCLIS